MGRIQSFLSHYETEKTKRGYLGHLDKFLRFVYSDSRDTETKADSYFTEGRNYLKDVEGFLVSTSKEAPMTRRMRLSTVKLFLIDNDVDWANGTGRHCRGGLRGRGLSPWTRFQPQTNSGG